ncbi:helix-turn-helix domain-containing protein [Streptomyces albireticuli]|uniref:helix-turn-helix domain-containing protein n=1 Tax=Streptomyces albireticuli TaxID=1940 RepID=UPI001E5540C9|nr:helix-turn-helix domain-containing protein [Streptomyces albireticuli]MCD9146023.1 helix-turn-helix domain-containing protein [Streptomyces albireticuli]
MPSRASAPARHIAVMRPVPPAQQWVSTTLTRIASDPYSWMQAVHWVDGHTTTAGRGHGPRWCLTTMRVAQLLAQISPCRPGIAYLARRLTVSERTIQYHLQLLREAGLLTYIVKGSRVRRERAQASEFARTIPPAFDKALGLRTVGEGVHRRVTGISESGWTVIAALARKAARKVRKPRSKCSTRGSKTVPSGDLRCTPMGGSTSPSSSAGTSIHPSESKLATGKRCSSRSKTSARGGRRKLNKVGRRHQLAFELVQQVPWLGRAAVPRLAWVARHVADAGWTATEVVAWLEVENVARRVHRPAAFLAHRLRGAHLLLDTPAKRAACVAAWRDSRRSAQQRHVEWHGDWQAPSSPAVRRMVAEAFTTLPREPGGKALPPLRVGEDGRADLEQLSREEVVDLRAAEKHPEMIRMAVEACGEAFARRLYTHHLVDRVMRLSLTGREALHHP